jgi:hypothetical protein
MNVGFDARLDGRPAGREDTARGCRRRDHPTAPEFVGTFEKDGAA